MVGSGSYTPSPTSRANSSTRVLSDIRGRVIRQPVAVLIVGISVSKNAVDGVRVGARYGSLSLLDQGDVLFDGRRWTVRWCRAGVLVCCGRECGSQEQNRERQKIFWIFQVFGPILPFISKRISADLA